MNDVRQTLLWSLLIFSLVMLWEGWMKETGQAGLFSPATVEAAAPAGSAPSPNLAVPQPMVNAAPGAPTAAGVVPPVAAAVTPPTASAIIEIKTDTVKASIDTLGGSMVELALLKHTDQEGRGEPIKVLHRDTAGVLEIAQSGLVSDAGPMPDHTTPMTVLTTERSLAAGQDSLKVVLESAPVSGVKRVLTYVFKPGSYVVDVQEDIINTSDKAIKPQVYVQLQRDGLLPPKAGFLGAPTSYTGAAVYTESAKFQKLHYDEIGTPKAEFVSSSSDGWVAAVQHYFAAAWLKNDAQTRNFYARKLDDNHIAVGMMFPLPELAAGQSEVFKSQLFVGPQEEKALAAIAPGLELVKDYGIVTILAKPLYWLLHFIHTNVVQNWGWAIVLLVVLIKAAFYWLNAKAYASMAKMKAINPKIQAMRERLKDKPQEMQQEMLRIYREEKVNPVGGCLPIIIQIPVFIALYWVLLSSVEIRNASWLYVHDLAQPDSLFGHFPFGNVPIGPLPFLMLVSSLVQTWLNPTPPDPIQAKMMWIMPIMFSVMFFFFPAGLVLYWFTNNVLSIAQQWFINRRLGVN